MFKKKTVIKVKTMPTEFTLEELEQISNKAINLSRQYDIDDPKEDTYRALAKIARKLTHIKLKEQVSR